MTDTPTDPGDKIEPRVELRVEHMLDAALGVKAITLVAADGAALPAFSAGSHVELELATPEGPLTRQYSLCNDPSETHRWVVGVGLHPASRGGSRHVHRALAAGTRLKARLPRNRFVLDESAGMTVLVAGGIGVTPLLAMARRLSALQRPWRFYYCAKTPAHAAFLPELLALGGEVIPVHDGCPGVRPLDLQAVVASCTPQTHLYCCGPSSMLKAFEAAGRGRDPSTMHVEWFEAPAAATPSTDEAQALTVHLERSGRTLQVPAGRSILDVALEAGVDVHNSCGDGVCGSCETRVLAGRPLHRDHVLTAAERARGDRMMVCVSRCLDPELTLDL